MSSSLIRAGLLARGAARRPETDVVQHPFVFAPFRSHAYVEVEIHARSEELLELLPRRGPDALDHLAAPPDDDRLMRFAIDDNRGVEPQESPRALRFLGVVETVDHDSARERNLRPRE